MAGNDEQPVWDGEEEILMGDVMPEYLDPEVRPLPECIVGNVDAGDLDDWD